MRLTRQQLRDSLYAVFDFNGLGIKPMAVEAAAGQLLRYLDTEPLTKQQLRERAREVAASLGRGYGVAVDDDELTALARAWGVEVADESTFSARLLTSPTTQPNVYDVHDGTGKVLLTVDTRNNLNLLHEMIAARYQQPAPSWHVKYAFIEHQSSRSMTVKATDANEAARLVRQRHNGLFRVVIDEIEPAEDV